MEAMVHRSSQAQRDKAPVAIELCKFVVAEQVFQRIPGALDLQQIGADDQPGRADDGVARIIPAARTSCAFAAPTTAAGGTCSLAWSTRCQHTRRTHWPTCPRLACTCCARGPIPCVLVNPAQGLHPNMAAPADSSLVDSGRRAGFDKAAYGAWLKELRAVCTEHGIALIFDKVFLGLRLAPGGAQEYFGVRADLVTYGKTLGGLPMGVVCGRRRFMKRYRDDRPVDICFARGTFNSHPCVMGAMHEFLIRLDTPEIRKPRGCQLEVVLQNSGYDPAGYHCEPVGTSAGAALPKRISEKWPSGGIGRRSIRWIPCGVLAAQRAKRPHGNSDRQPTLATG